MKKQILNTIGLAAIAALLCVTCDNGLDRSPTHAGDVDRFLGRINPTGTTGGGTTYTLTVTRDPVDGGNVTVNNGQNNPEQSTHNAGTSITVRAAANSGHTFQNWTAVSGSLPSGITATSANITFNINSNVDIRANFQKGVVQPPGTGSNFTETVGGVAFSMVYVKGGPFEMGCTSEQDSDCYDEEKPSHNVTLSDYYVGRYEVTQGLWKAVMVSLPSSISSSYGMGDNYPVYDVNWNDIQTFITELNTKTVRTYRLPTEAEWEFAARGGNSSLKYKYSGSNTIGDVAWYSGNSGNSTHPVGTKASNELGIYDMSGNVLERVSDLYGSYSSFSVTNPTGPASGFDRVYRGGSWYSDAGDCRVSIRFYYFHPGARNPGLGFRLAVSP